jgi:hypothetical protein
MAIKDKAMPEIVLAMIRVSFTAYSSDLRAGELSIGKYCKTLDVSRCNCPAKAAFSINTFNFLGEE